MTTAVPPWKNAVVHGLPVAVLPMAEGLLTVVFAPRADIETMSTTGLVDLLRQMVSSSEALRASLLGLVVTTTGYESDVRALDDVPEVRAFVAKVSSDCPWWGHAMHQGIPELSTFTWWSRALAGKRKPNKYGADGSCRSWVDGPSHQMVILNTLKACLTIYRSAISQGELTTDEADTMCSPLLAALEAPPSNVRQ